MKEPILSREEVEALAHRICARYIHSENIHLCQYTFGITTLERFAQAYEAALLEKLCGEPRAWLVEGGRMYRDKAFIDASNADTSIAERNDGARKTALYALKTAPTPSPRDTLIEEIAEMVDHMGEGRRLEEYVGAIREMKSGDKGGT